jgi:zinc knuckle protein
LSALGRAVSIDKYIAVLIGTLLSCYDNPINSLTFSCKINNIDITPTAIICAATCEYEKHVLCKENKVQDEAFATAAKADKKAKKENIECFNCKKKGHYQSECWAAQSDILDPYE